MKRDTPTAHGGKNSDKKQTNPQSLSTVLSCLRKCRSVDNVAVIVEKRNKSYCTKRADSVFSWTLGFSRMFRGDCSMTSVLMVHIIFWAWDRNHAEMYQEGRGRWRPMFSPAITFSSFFRRNFSNLVHEKIAIGKYGLRPPPMTHVPLTSITKVYAVLIFLFLFLPFGTCPGSTCWSIFKAKGTC